MVTGGKRQNVGGESGGDGVGLGVHMVILDPILFDGEESAEADVEGKF